MDVLANKLDCHNVGVFNTTYKWLVILRVHLQKRLAIVPDNDVEFNFMLLVNAHLANTIYWPRFWYQT